MAQGLGLPVERFCLGVAASELSWGLVVTILGRTLKGSSHESHAEGMSCCPYGMMVPMSPQGAAMTRGATTNETYSEPLCSVALWHVCKNNFLVAAS